MYSAHLSVIYTKNHFCHIDRTTKLEGEHVYPFSVPLPLQLPSTFKEEYGEVQYKALVTIVVPWSLNKRTEVDFEIKSLLNLNDEPSLAVSIY